MSGGMGDFIAGREHQNNAGEGGASVGESVKILSPAGGPAAEHRNQNKNKQTIKTQGEVCIASSTCKKKKKCDTVKSGSK